MKNGYVEVDTKEIDELLKKLALSFKDLSPVMDKLSQRVDYLIDQTFITKQNPYNEPWAPLKQPRRDGSTGQLIKSSALRGSIHPSHTKNSFKLSTNVSYAFRHQYKSVNNKQRAFFPIKGRRLTKVWNDDIMKIVMSHIDGLLL